jgi:hypothetical protein
MSTPAYAELLQMLSEVERIRQLQTLKIVLQGLGAPVISLPSAGSDAREHVGTMFDSIRTNSLLYEETERLRNMLLVRLHGLHRNALDALRGLTGTVRPMPRTVPSPTWTEDDIVDILDGAQMTLLKYPVASQAAFSALVREGRRFAETESGKQWLERLKSSPLMQKLRWAWETTSLNMLEEDEGTIVPSTYLEALLRAAGTPDMETLLGRVKGMGHG